jgi:hypothetical protein
VCPKGINNGEGGGSILTNVVPSFCTHIYHRSKIMSHIVFCCLDKALLLILVSIVNYLSSSRQFAVSRGVPHRAGGPLSGGAVQSLAVRDGGPCGPLEVGGEDEDRKYV